MNKQELIELMKYNYCEQDCCNCNYGYCPRDTIIKVIENSKGKIEKIK